MAKQTQVDTRPFSYIRTVRPCHISSAAKPQGVTHISISFVGGRIKATLVAGVRKKEKTLRKRQRGKGDEKREGREK